MKKFMIILAVLSGVAVARADEPKKIHAMLATQKVMFSYAGLHSAYSCDYVQNETETVLKKLGARDVKVTCTGGLPYDSFTNTTATFRSIRETSEEKATMTAQQAKVAVGFNESCDLHDQIIREVLPAFEVYAKKSQNSCWDSQGNVQYRLTVLK